jgi:hypothetical protein
MSHVDNRNTIMKTGRVDRKGISLIETVVIMSVGAILTGVVVSCMAAVFRYDRHLRTHAIERDQLQILAQQLRGDIRQADRCKFDSEDLVLSLERCGKDKISYHWIGDHVERITYDGENKTIGRFQVPPNLKVTTNPVDAASGQLMKVNFSNHDKDTANKGRALPAWNLEVAAEVGKDLLPHRHPSQQDEP